MEASQLSAQYPCLYHMAHEDAWPGIQTHGLLSTSAVLDLFEVTGPRRDEIESRRRPELVTIGHPVHGRATIRDNKPLSDSALHKCLSGMTLPEFYRVLNGKVFFWLTEQRLERLLAARAYRDSAHTVITVSTERLLDAHGDRVMLSPINTGSTAYTPQPRGPDTFRAIADYPFDDWAAKRGGAAAVAELAVEYSVPDIKSVALSAEIRSPSGARTVLWTA